MISATGNGARRGRRRIRECVGYGGGARLQRREDVDQRLLGRLRVADEIAEAARALDLQEVEANGIRIVHRVRMRERDRVMIAQDQRRFRRGPDRARIGRHEEIETARVELRRVEYRQAQAVIDRRWC